MSLTPELDDELVSAYLDGELSANEMEAVASLVQSDSTWAERVAEFKKLSSDVKSLPAPELSDKQRDLAYELAAADLPSGAERRRVPRFRRRWMLVAAFFVPAALTLTFFQSPGATCRLYLKKDGLELQAGRSILEQDFGPSKTWHSPKLWGNLELGEAFYLNFQVDAEEQKGAEVSSTVEYDFNGDGVVDRTEKYSAVKVNDRKGWERFTPSLEESRGEFENIAGGEIRVTLEVTGVETVKISGTPGELILPYKALKTSKGANQ